MKRLNQLTFVLFALGVLMLGGGCQSLIYDDLSDCPQGVYLSFYAKTPCQADTTYLGKVNNLSIFAFDEKDHLVSVTHTPQADLGKGNSFLIPGTHGLYSFIGWAGMDDSFEMRQLKEHVSTKRDVLLALKTTHGKAADLSHTHLWQGASRSILLHDPSEVGSEYAYASINLHELTNRLHVTVELDETILGDAKPEDFEVIITSANGLVRVDGTMPLDNPTMTYPSALQYTQNALKADYTLLDLQTGYNNLITVRNKKTKQEVWKSDLIGSILLKNTNVNLECEHDFNVKFVIKDQCAECGTYICWAIYVNNWMVHSFQVDLENRH